MHNFFLKGRDLKQQQVVVKSYKKKVKKKGDMFSQEIYMQIK